MAGRRQQEAQAGEADGQALLGAPRPPRFSAADGESFSDWFKYAISLATATMQEERRILSIFSSLDGRVITSSSSDGCPDPAAVLRMNFAQFSAALSTAFMIPEARHQNFAPRFASLRVDGSDLEGYIRRFSDAVSVNPLALAQADYVSLFIGGIVTVSCPTLTVALTNANPNTVADAIACARRHRALLAPALVPVAAISLATPSPPAIAVPELVAALRLAGFPIPGGRARRGQPGRGQGSRPRRDEGGNKSARASGGACYACGAFGHYARQCPNKAASFYSRVRALSPLSHVFMTNLKPSRMVLGHLKDGRVIRILIDSGAECNLVSTAFVHVARLDTHPTEGATVFNFADGGTYTSRLASRVSFTAGEFSTTLNAVRLCRLGGYLGPGVDTGFKSNH